MDFPAFSTARECYHSRVMSKGRLRLAYGVLAAVLAAPLALGVKAQDAQAPPPAAAQQPAPAPPAPADQQTPVFRSDINFVRVDVIVDRQAGQPCPRSEAGRLRSHGRRKPQAIQTFKLINVSEDTGVGSDPPREDAQPDRGADGSGAGRRAAVCDFSGRLPRAAREQHARAGAIARFIENSLQPKDMVGIMYPLWSISDVILTREPQGVAGASASFTGRKYDYTPRNAFEERYVHYVSTMEAERIRNQVTLTAIKGLIIKLGGLRERRKAHRARQRGLHECVARRR